MTRKTVLMLGTFDSKGAEFDYLYEELKRRDVDILTMNTGVFEPVNTFPLNISAEQVAEAAGADLAAVRARGDRGEAMKVMCEGAKAIAVKLHGEDAIHGVISMGGGGGTSIATTAMQALPIGFPKVCITTLASGDTSKYVGTRDIILFPSIVDICGINNFSRIILSRAAGAICGMMALEPVEVKNAKPLVAISMFGNSTQCVEQCAELLRQKGCEPIIFHATGGGGRSMEELIREGHCAAVLDITTTEWADELCGGILTAGPDRLNGPSIAGIPHVIAPGCLDMVNFGTFDSVPAKYKEANRLFYPWNPMVTLMRTNVEENCRLGQILAEKANATSAPVAVIVPRNGLSILDGEGQLFCDREADEALTRSLEENLRKDIPLRLIDTNINEMEFSQAAVDLLVEIWKP